uniref:Uncharacterized protein n=1 Tax=Otus sunia TaxID=257818 RepID=A0A8C8AC91_9STRI
LCLSNMSWVRTEPRQSSCAISVARQASEARLRSLRKQPAAVVPGERAGGSAFACATGRALAREHSGRALPPVRCKQQWQQMKMNAMRTTKGRPNSTAKQTVLKTPSSCLVRMSSKMELKKELIFCSMLAHGQAACATPLEGPSGYVQLL